MEFDFGGYVTKNDLLCADGRTIRKNAFKAQNGQKVPLVWMHQRNEPENVLGHSILENREDGVYGYCKFNDSPRGRQAKLLVEHGDITSMSIFANNLVQKGGNVTHGMIREVSLVIAPANPGALIDNPVVQHGDDGEMYEDLTRAMITCGTDIELGVEYDLEHSEDSKSVKMKAKKKKAEEEDDPDEDDEDEDYDEDDDTDVDDEEDDSDDADDEDDKEDKKKMKGKEQTKSMQHADDDEGDDEETVQDVYNSMTDKQKKVVAYMIGAALAEKEDDTAEQSDMEGEDFMSRRNVFDQEMEMSDKSPSLSHDQISAIFADAKKCGSLKEAFLEHAQSYGIENIDILFPDAKAVANEPYMIKRDTDWVAGVLNETNHVPFSRIKSTAADITADEARAKGYVKGNLKKEEVIKLLKRITTPTTVYKKQKLDRDDIIDITDLNVVAWLKAEMRVMLNEELARAFLVGDGREADDPDKINEENIRPIAKDDDMYAHHFTVPADTAAEDIPDQILMAQEEYKGSGNPSFYTTSSFLLKMLLLKDKLGRRLYNTEAELASALSVSKIVKVPVMERVTREAEGKTMNLLGVIVNLRDYTVGATAGGQVSMFDDFDIDYNQYKYLMETRCCGALVIPKSAVVIEQEAAAAGASVEDEIG